MKLFSRLLQTSHSLMHASHKLLRALAIIPFLMACSFSHAEVDIDHRGNSDRVDFSQAELDQILAPIALYPDTVLSQVLIASTYPIEVVQADRWASTHTSVKGADAVAKVEDKDWDPSVKALVAFPDILNRMSDDIDWTQKLGDAFLSDEARVMDTVQNLRQKAYKSGNLSKVKHLKVERDANEIIIEPAEERIVYVPVYDTRVVYGSWWWPDYPPVYWHHPSSYVYVSGFYWGPSIYIGPTFFYSSCLWRERHVVVVDRYVAGPRPVFYTSRSIVTYHGAREWRHEPVHRRGVAYYNNDLRDRFGSHRESYRDARVYRTQHREEQSPMHMQPRNNINRNDSNRVEREDRSRPVTVDRSEQLRERINQRNHDSVPQQRIERNDNNQQRPTMDRINNDSNNRIDRQEHPRTLPSRQTETNNWGATRPTLNTQQERSVEQPTNDARDNAPRNREMHNDGRNVRQLPNERIEQRRDSVPQRGKPDDDERKQGRFERVM